jgi:hypothetical protein
MSDLLAEITVRGATYRLSKQGLAGEYFYHPFVVRMPTLELGQVEDSGKIGVKFGFISLTNEPTNPDHPFGVVRYNSLFTIQQLFPCKLKWGEDGRVLFDGQIFLQTITESEITFALTDKSYELGARPFSLTESFIFIEKIRVYPTSNNQSILLIAPNHPFQTGQVIIFERMTSIGTDLEYTGPSFNTSTESQNLDSDNYYIVDSVEAVSIGGVPTPAFTIQNRRLIPVTKLPSDAPSPTAPYDELIYASDANNHRCGFPQRIPFTWGSFQHKTPVLKKRSNEIANPGLVLNDNENPVEVREDGVVIYTTNSDPSGLYYSEYWGRLGSVSGTYSQSGTTITITASSHGVSAGQTVDLDFTTGASANGVYTVTAVTNSSVFTVTAGSSVSTSGNVTVNRGIAPTATTITLNRNTFQGTTLSISGKSNKGVSISGNNSSTLAEFYQWVANEFGFTLNVDKI